MTLRKLLKIIFIVVILIMVCFGIFTMGTFYQDHKDAPTIDDLTENMHICETQNNALINDNQTKDNYIHELEQEIESLNEQLKKN